MGGLGHEHKITAGCSFDICKGKTVFKKETSKYGSYSKTFLGMVLLNKNNSITILIQRKSKNFWVRKWEKKTPNPRNPIRTTYIEAVKLCQGLGTGILTCFLSVAFRDLAA